MEGTSEDDPASGDPCLKEDSGRPARLLIRVALVFAGVWFLAAGAFVVVGALAARAGAEQVRAIDLTLGVAELVDGDIDAHVAAALDRFETSDRFLNSPVLAPARLLPVVGRQLRSAGSLAGTAADVLAGSASAVEVLRTEIDGAAPAGTDRVESLARLRDELLAIEAVLSNVDLGPSEALVAPLRDARDEVAAEIDDARKRTGDVLAVVDAVHRVLEGPSRYLVLAANNAEMRVGSAMILSVGAVDIVEGRIEVAQEFEPAGDMVLSERVPLPQQMAELWGWSDIGSDFRSLALSARFPVSAELGVQMWAASGRGDVDGVVMIDTEGLSSLLRIAGPVLVEGRPVDADGVIPFLLHEQYENQDLDDGEGNAERRDRLRLLAAAALGGLGSADVDLRTMLDELRRARDGRHLMVWSPEERVQMAWQSLKVHGDLDSRSLLVALANFDNSKLDPYVAVSVSVEARRDGDHAVVDLAIEAANDAPDDLPSYAAGADGGQSYRGLVAVHLPAGATAIALIGLDGLAARGPDGPTTVVASRVDIARGESRTGNLRFRMRVEELADVEVLPSGRIPPVRWSIGGERRFDDSPSGWPPHVP